MAAYITYRHFRRLILPSALAVLALVVCIGNAYRIDFEDTSLDMYRFGNRKLANDDFSGAIEDFRAASAARPSLDRVNLNIGVAFLRMGFPDSAIGYFERELEIGLASTEALNNLAVVARLDGDDTLSYRYARRAIESSPFNREALVNYALAARRIGEYNSALTALDRAIAGGVEESDLFFHRGILRFDLRDYEAANADFYRSLELLNTQRQPVFATLSEYDGTTSQRKRIESEARIRYHIGTIAAQGGLIDSAVTMLSTSLELDPSLVPAGINLMSLLIQKGSFDEAEELAVKTLKSGERSGLVWHQLAVIYLNTGRREDAMRAVDSALSIDPGFAPAQALKAHLEQ
jgi:tetratricopeptide (TPR) repeat protein